MREIVVEFGRWVHGTGMVLISLALYVFKVVQDKLLETHGSL